MTPSAQFRRWTKPTWPTTAVMATQAVLGIVLAAGLPPDAWYVSDPGAKLAAVRTVVAHPLRPFEVDIPASHAEGAVALPQPFFVRHEDHAHVVTPPLFPVLSAPFVAWFGLRGMYVLPLVAWLAIGPLCIRLARVTSVRAPAWLLAIGAVSLTPLLFYGLEFWEHAPAVACAVGAVCLMLSPLATVRGRIAAGVLAALAVLLRPEAAWLVAAALVVDWRRARSIRSFAPVAVGLGAGLLPMLGYNIAHYGALSGPHLAGNFSGFADSWTSDRLAHAATWLAPSALPGWMAVVALGAGSVLARFAGMRGAGRVLVGVAVGAFAALAALGHEQGTLFAVFPVALLALLVDDRSDRTRQELWLLGLLPLAGILLTAPNDGGGQWGPRYLMVCVPALLVLAVRSATTLTSRSRTGVVLAVGVLLAGVTVSRSAYVDLRGSKQFYAGLVRATAAATSDVSVVATDVWWVPTAHAAVLDPQRIVYAGTAADLDRLLASIAPADVLFIGADTGGSRQALAAALERAGYLVQSETLTPGPRHRLIRLIHAGR